MKYEGSCHCGAITFDFEGPQIVSGLRCNCTICVRKGAIMTAFTISGKEMNISSAEGSLSTYEFGSQVAKHHFCNRCGIYTFHQTLRKPGHYRVNIGCLDGVAALDLPFEVFDGAAL